LKNSFQAISPVKFLRKSLNISSPQAWKFAEITGLVPFSTATGFINNHGVGRDPTTVQAAAYATQTEVARRPGDPPTLVADPAKAQEVLGWTAKRNLADIVSSAWAWMQKN